MFSDLGTRFAVVTVEGEKIESCNPVKIKQLFLKELVHESSPILSEGEVSWLRIADVFATSLWAKKSSFTERVIEPKKPALTRAEEKHKEKSEIPVSEAPIVFERNPKTQVSAATGTQNRSGLTSIFPEVVTEQDPTKKNVVEAYIQGWFKFAVFKGRSGRKEYWSFALINAGIYVVLGSFSGPGGSTESNPAALLQGLFWLVSLIPAIAVTVRRLHDTSRTGAYALLSVVPCLGPLILLVFNIQEGDIGENEYGPDPYSS